MGELGGFERERDGEFPRDSEFRVTWLVARRAEEDDNDELGESGIELLPFVLLANAGGVETVGAVAMLAFGCK